MGRLLPSAQCFGSRPFLMLLLFLIELPPSSRSFPLQLPPSCPTFAGITKRQQQKRICSSVPTSSSSTSTSTTRLYQGNEQPQEPKKQRPKRTPRFSQQAHAKRIKTPTTRPLDSHPPALTKIASYDDERDSSILYSSSSSSSTSNSFPSSPSLESRSERSNGRSSSKLSPRPPPLSSSFRSEKSIDELERIMSNRWGTLPDTTTNGQPKSNNKEKYTKNPSSSKLQWRRPVVDPWALDGDDDNSQPPSLPARNFVREYYDEDDEGFEYEEWDEDDNQSKDNLKEYIWEDEHGNEIQAPPRASFALASSSSNSSKKTMDIRHLISPTPVGDLGTKNSAAGTNLASSSSSSSSYFFNPNKQPSPETRSPSVPKENDSVRTNNPTKNKEDDEVAAAGARGKSQRPALAKPLFNDQGDPILLTVEEALRRFQATVDTMTNDDSNNNHHHANEDAVLPIVAYSSSSAPSPQEDNTWTNLGITSPVLLENLDMLSCPTPLPVQSKTVPGVLTGNDVMVGTYTGSGKTLAFLVPLIQRLLWDMEIDNGDDDDDGGNDEEGNDRDNDVTENNNIKMPARDPGLAILVVAPGRELASQIVSVARNLLAETPIRVQLAIGGTTFARNLEQLRKRKPHLIVGTPGRIAELVVGKPGEKSGRLKIGSLQAVVLDEFDALLEYKPHRDPTRAILKTLRERRRDSLQSILCSATATDIMDSAQVQDYLRPGFVTAMADLDDVLVTPLGPVKLNSKQQRRPPQVSRTALHGVVHVPHRRYALDVVRRILHTSPIPQQILIFVENARRVDIVVERLAERGIIAAPLHGGQGSDKQDRADVSKALREGYVGIVVATELAARGLDAPLLTHVINLDLATDASHYAHRAGRCGRGGRPGVVINITTSPKERNVPFRFAGSLGIDMHTVEPREGKLMMIDPDTQTLDP